MESFYSVDGNVNLCSHYGKQYGLSLKKLKVGLLYDPVIPFLDIYIYGKDENSNLKIQVPQCS